MNYEAIIKTYALNYDSHTHYNEINNLIKQNLDQNSLPFNNDIPIPLDTNVITGKHFGDINQQKIELKACSIGCNNLLWIYGADAQYLGLELKSSNPKEFQAAKKNNKNFNCKPVIVQSQVRERIFTGKGMNSKSNVVSEGLGVDCQCAYLLNQFTDSSIQKVFSLASLNKKLNDYSSSLKDQSQLIAKTIIKNITEYNSGEKDVERRKLVKKNFTLNFTKNTLGFEEARKKYQEIVKKFTPEQKTIFDFYHKHFREQLSNEKKYYISTDDKNSLNIAFATLLKGVEEKKLNSSVITSTIFEAYTFTERLSHLNFSLEPVYIAEELKQKQFQQVNSTSVKANQDIPITSIINKEYNKKLRSNSYRMLIDDETQGR